MPRANPAKAPRKRAARLAAVLTAVLALCACAAAPGANDAADDTRAAAAPSTAGVVGDAAAPDAFDIRVECADEDLRALVERFNTLQRYRAVRDLEANELARLMVLAERDVRNLLGTEGYFDPRVQVRRDGAAGARPTVVIAIEPGEPTTVATVDIGFAGDIAQSADAGARQQRQAIEDGWTLEPGRRFTQQRWSAAKTEALRQLVAQRYPRGRIESSRADIDAAQARARLGVQLDSGPLFRLGPSVVKGAGRYPPWLAERLSWLRPGDEYDQKALVDAQQRLTGSGYYDAAYISIDPDGDPAAVPVTYTVTEAKRHKLQLGVGYSTDSGPRLTLEHRDNTAFGSSWRTDTKLNLDRKQPLLQAELTSLPDEDGWRRAGLARTMRQDDGVLATLSQTVRAGVLKTEKDYDRNIYVQYEHANVTGSGSQAVPDALLGDGAAVSVNYAWTGRYFDNLQLPKRGHGLGLDLGLGLTTIGPRKPFARVAGRWLGFVPLGGGASRLQLRADAGAVLASDAARLPATNLFRTGGDATVRGYSYRSIGVPVGGLVAPGRYQAVGSIEWQRPILQERYPGLLEHTLFIDVGGVANRVGDLRAHWGVGTGVRLITPVGPMELAIAYGLQSHQVRLHMSVGFTF